jgi:hypothetical protein
LHGLRSNSGAIQNQIYLGPHAGATAGAERLDVILKVRRYWVLRSLQALAEADGDTRTAKAAGYASGISMLKANVAFFGVHDSTVNWAIRGGLRSRNPRLINA